MKGEVVVHGDRRRKKKNSCTKAETSLLASPYEYTTEMDDHNVRHRSLKLL